MANNLNFGGAGGISITGAAEIYVKMAKLGKTISDKVSRRALTKAINPVVVEAKANAPVGNDVLSGLLRDSIGVKVTNKKGTLRAVAGPMRGNKVRVGTRKKGKKRGEPIYKNPTRYAHFQEFGTVKQAAKPFLRPAWQKVGGLKALDTYTKELSDGLDKETAKLARQR